MDVILGASIIASFIAGMVALFAPCCIGFIFPAYMASVFKKKTKIIRMTMVFFAGIAVILIPIGLGAAWLASFFRDFHTEMYIVGGIFMVALGVMAILGKSLSLFPGLKNKHASAGSTPSGGQGMSSRSVFGLGVLSGAATSCCAPVLAGAMTLAVISGAFWKALIVVFAYVFGMVFPLFIGAYFYDSFKIENMRIVKGKLIRLNLGVKMLTVHTTNLVSAVIFMVMGVVLMAMAFSGNTFWAPEAQVGMGNWLNERSQKLLEQLMLVPDLFWGVAILGLFLFFVVKAKRVLGNKHDAN
ncbi:MAG: cytochrome c biogenesis protein CcdA [Candidatus Spechtbacteria bacterium]|nr:cytochrome c biogenesis protein CcdA [Candidatus Spechtbacteria bacterium]